MCVQDLFVDRILSAVQLHLLMVRVLHRGIGVQYCYAAGFVDAQSLNTSLIVAR